MTGKKVFEALKHRSGLNCEIRRGAIVRPGDALHPICKETGMLAEQARTLARYNRWMNEKFYALSAQLTDAQRKQDCKAYFKSIHGTLNHLLLGDRIWLGRFQNQPCAATRLDEELYADFDELREARQHTDTRIEAWAAALNDDLLAAELRYTSVVNPAPRSIALWLAVTHFFNHQTHHRGQLSTLLSQFGLDCGVTDLMWLPDSPDPERST